MQGASGDPRPYLESIDEKERAMKCSTHLLGLGLISVLAAQAAVAQPRLLVSGCSRPNAQLQMNV